MQTLLPLLVALRMLCASPPEMDLANLREVLHDRQDPRGQSQAALLLVQSHDPAAARIVRQGLRHPENEEAFHALAAAIRLRPDARFVEDLLAALTANRPRLRQAIAETLAVLPDPRLVEHLEKLARDARIDIRVRQTALWTLGRCGRKAAAGVLIEHLAADGSEDLRRVTASALTDLTGQGYGTDAPRWKRWWARHKDMTNEAWLEMRLAYQATRAQRLEGDLARARAQVLRLQQQVYNRLPVGERLGHIQSVLDHEEPALRALAVMWSMELLPAADLAGQKQLATLLLRLSHDGSHDVQRAAVLALGRVPDPAALARLLALLGSGAPSARAAAARALAQQARGTEAGARARQKQVVPALQKALEDKAPEVVVEAGEALGVLGAPEAGPVLIGLLRHPSEHVRRTAAQALERVADAAVLDGLLKGLDDPSVTVRFSLVGALGRAAGDGQALAAEQRKRLLARLEKLLRQDADAGVRSRAATVLGECAAPAMLETLWRLVQSGSEGRVQEKAWDAFVEIVARSGSLTLLAHWDKALQGARQPTRRVQLLAGVYTRWEARAETRVAANKALEALIQAQLDAGKWSSAGPLITGLLGRGAETDAARTRCLGWLLKAGELALHEGNRAEAMRAVQEAQPYLGKGDKLTEAFEKLEKLACRKE